MYFTTLHREIVRKLRQVGLWGTLKHIIIKLFRELRKLGLAYRHFQHEERAFDRKYGTETSQIVRVGAMDIPDNKLEHTFAYQASSVELLNRILRGLPISYEGYILIDFGSGKGRALLLASNFPFKKIIGIELSHGLSEIAHQNIYTYESESQRCYNLESLCVDATDFEIPDEKAVFYFNNPFDEQVMRKVLSNIEDSLKKYYRQIYIVYVNPMCRKVLDQAAFLQVVKEEKHYLIYASKK